MNVFIIAAITLDGYIAEATDQISTSWTSKADKKFFVERTKKAGVIVMGSKTYDTIGRPLPGRLNIVYTRDVNQPVPPEHQANLRYVNSPPAELIQQLKKEGFSEVAVCGGASVYSMFMEAGVVNKLYLTLEPVVFGKGVKLFAEEVSAKLQLKELTKLSEDVLLLEYDVMR